MKPLQGGTGSDCLCVAGYRTGVFPSTLDRNGLGRRAGRGHVLRQGHKRYPYLLRNLSITHVNQAWSADITYVPLLRGFIYLVAVIDWYSRYVLAWQLSNTLDGGFCLDALRQALVKGRPKIFNTDQGAQFTADAFTACLLAANIQVSMDGRGRALDNVFCERLWRSVKYENIYLNQYDTVRQLHTGLTAYFEFYNHERPHQSLNYRTAAEEHSVLYSEPAAFAQVHLTFPISWSNDWGQPFSTGMMPGKTE